MVTTVADAAQAAGAEPPSARRSDDLRARLTPPLPSDGWWGWFWPGVLAAIAAVLRFAGLTSPSGYVFDEVYYAKDARSLLEHGVELNQSGPGPAFIVHPPLGKWLIAVGQAAFGNTELGWRVPAAVAGSVSVLVLARTARRMTRSTLLGCVAGLLLALDGLHFVQSRVAMLDIFLLLWIVAAFGCLVADRDAGRARLAELLAERPAPPSGAGPPLGLRWWRVGAGACLGAACATKWSGLYALGAFALLALAWDGGARRAVGVARPLRAALIRDAPGLAAALLLLPAVLYVASWTGWFLTGTGWDRHWADGRSSVVLFVPAPLRGWWHYHAEIWRFHTTLSSRHPYQSHPVGWLLLARPVDYYYTAPKLGELGCSAPGGCSRTILALGTPAIWWASIPALVVMAWQWLARRDWRAAAALVGAAAGIAPWIPQDLHHRTMFLFYALPALPFLVLALTLCAGLLLGTPSGSLRRRRWGALAPGGYLCYVAAQFFYFHPIFTAAVLPYGEWLRRMWLPSWI